MSPVRIAMFVCAAIVAIIVGVLVQGSNESAVTTDPAAVVVSSEGTNKKSLQIRVLAAARDLPIGRYIQANDLGWRAWPADVPSDTLILFEKNPDALSQFNGFVVHGRMANGEPVTRTKIVDPDGAGFLATLLGPGMRAASVSIDEIRAADGFVVPNDRVDVILLRRDRSDNRRTVLQRNAVVPQVIIQNIRVLAINGIFSRDELGKQKRERGRTKQTITLEVTPSDSLILSAASSVGEVYLALRGPGDVADRSGATKGGLSLLPGGNSVLLYAGGKASPTILGAGDN